MVEDDPHCYHYARYFNSLPLLPMKTQDLVKFIILKTEIVPLSKLTPAKWNPRIITDKRFKDLCASIKDDPQFMVLRPMLASKKGILYAGNMRYRALAELGYTEGPVIYTDIDEKTAKFRSIRDNAHFGEFQMDELATMIVEFDPIKVQISGLPEVMLAQLKGAEDFSSKNKEEDVAFIANKLEHTCPKCGFKFSDK